VCVGGGEAIHCIPVIIILYTSVVQP